MSVDCAPVDLLECLLFQVNHDEDRQQQLQRLGWRNQNQPRTNQCTHHHITGNWPILAQALAPTSAFCKTDQIDGDIRQQRHHHCRPDVREQGHHRRRDQREAKSANAMGDAGHQRNRADLPVQRRERKEFQAGPDRMWFFQEIEWEDARTGVVPASRQPTCRHGFRGRRLTPACRFHCPDIAAVMGTIRRLSLSGDSFSDDWPQDEKCQCRRGKVEYGGDVIWHRE